MIEFNFMSNSRYLLASKTKVRLPTHKETMFSAAENDWDEDQLGGGGRRDREFIAMQRMETSSGVAVGETGEKPFRRMYIMIMMIMMRWMCPCRKLHSFRLIC